MQDRQDPTVMQHAVILPIRSGDVRWLEREPALSDMLADPITQLLMQRDGVQEGEIRRLAARLRDRAAARRAPGREAANDFALDLPL